jgi:hypothetical protein
MLRWLGIILAIGLVSTSADAQVFKPKAKKAAATKPAASGEPKKAKKQPRAAANKKRVAKKKAKAAERDSAEDETSESESKGTDKDYVKIWDDDSIE